MCVRLELRRRLGRVESGSWCHDNVLIFVAPNIWRPSINNDAEKDGRERQQFIVHINIWLRNLFACLCWTESLLVWLISVLLPPLSPLIWDLNKIQSSLNRFPFLKHQNFPISVAHKEAAFDWKGNSRSPHGFRSEREMVNPLSLLTTLPVLISKICLWIDIIFYVMFASLRERPREASGSIYSFMWMLKNNKTHSSLASFRRCWCV